MDKSGQNITALLLDVRNGSKKAAEELIAIVYQDLHRLAVYYFRNEGEQQTLQPTALVHELYLRLLASEPICWQNRAHFFAVAAQQMRRILTDRARARNTQKRGGGQGTPLAEIVDCAVQNDANLLALHEALGRLENVDQRAARVVELRFFGGLQEKEVAEVLGISVGTVKRDWEFARAWLIRQLACP